MKILVLLFFLHTALSLPPYKINSVLARNNGQVGYKIDLNNGEGELSYESDADQKTYSYRLGTSDGTVKHESGHFEQDNLVVEGGYEFVGSNGIRYKVTYTADKNGYRPKVISGSESLPGGTKLPTLRPTLGTTPEYIFITTPRPTTQRPTTTTRRYYTSTTDKSKIGFDVQCSLCGSGVFRK